MSKRSKRRQKMAQNPRNVRFEDLRSLLGDYGFILDRTKGSHHTFVGFIGTETVSVVIPFHKPVNSVYVLKVLALIEQIEALDNEETSNDDNIGSKDD